MNSTHNTHRKTLVNEGIISDDKPSVKKNYDLDNPTIRTRILRYVSDHVASKRFELITCRDDLDVIRDNDYVICPSYYGVRSMAVIISRNSQFYAITFTKKGDRRQSSTTLFPIDVAFDRSLYCGTIFDGIFFQHGEVKYFVIDEVYLLEGINQMLKPKDERLNDLSSVFKYKVRQTQNYQIYINRCYDLSSGSLRQLNEKICSDVNINEIVFYPKRHGKKVYSYTILPSDRNEHIVKISVFKMRKTKSPDVFKLYTLNDTKMGVAYIPDTATSKKCRAWFQDSRKTELRVKCQMSSESAKWIPVEMED